MGEEGDRFEVLFVCHANICRSPLAEWLARRTVAERLRGAADTFAVASAGTHALSGNEMHPLSAQVLLESGIDANGFRSRPITARLLASAHLVLTATRQQRADCVTVAPMALRRTFTMRQFARLAGAVGPASLGDLSPATRAHMLLRSVTSVRGSMQPVSACEDDIADPVGLPLDDFRACARELDGVFEKVFNVIAPT